MASESFGPVGNANGKVLLNGPYANSFNDIGASLFGVIIIAAIFGTSILRDFQRDTYQMLFTKPISKGAYLGGRWAGSFVTTVFAFSGMMVGTWLGTFAPWADHARIGPNHLWWYLQPFLSIIVIQIFFLGSLFFMVAALSRKIFVVYLQGVALFMIYLVGLTVYFAARSLEHFWSGISRPDRARALRQRLALLDGDREEHAARALGHERVLAGCVPLQSRSLDAGWRRLIGSDMGALSDVGGGAHSEIAGQARGQGSPARVGGGAADTFPGGRELAARASDLRRANELHTVSVAHAAARAHDSARDSLLGNRRAAHRVRDQQRAVRGTNGRGECLARHLSHAAGRRGLVDTFLLHRRDALCR